LAHHPVRSFGTLPANPLLIFSGPLSREPPPSLTARPSLRKIGRFFQKATCLFVARPVFPFDNAIQQELLECEDNSAASSERISLHFFRCRSLRPSSLVRHPNEDFQRKTIFLSRLPFLPPSIATITGSQTPLADDSPATNRCIFALLLPVLACILLSKARFKQDS